MPPKSPPVEEKIIEARRFNCSKCKSKFDTWDHLRRHYNNNHPIEAFKCPDCDLSFATAQKQKLHHAAIHKPKGFKCSTCGRGFTSPDMLRKHSKLHTTKPHFCQLCVQIPDTRKFITFATKEELDKHMKNKSHECQYCNFVGSGYALKEHLERLASDPSHTSSAKRDDDDDETADTGPKQQGFLKKQPQKKDVEEAKEQNPVLQMFSEKAHAQVKSILASARDVAGSALRSCLPETPTAAQQNVMGRNLKKFENALYVDPLGTIVDPMLPPGESLNRFVSQPPLRQLWAYYVRNTESNLVKTIIVQNYEGKTRTERSHDNCDFDVTAYQFSIETASAIATYLRRVLQRTSSALNSLSIPYKFWALFSARRLAFNADKSLTMTLEKPELKMRKEKVASRSATQQYHIWIPVHGYDLSKNTGWLKSLRLAFGEIDQNAKLPTLDASRYRWTGTDPQPPEQLLRTFSREKINHSFELAKYLTVKYMGYIGTQEDLLATFKRDCKELWVRGRKLTRTPVSTKPGGGHEDLEIEHSDEDIPGQDDDATTTWSGQDFFFITSGTLKTFNVTQIEPTAWMMKNMKARKGYIILDTIEQERAVSVLSGMLEALRQGHDPDVVWGVGCALADHENANLGTQALPIIFCNIKDKGHSSFLHICPDCLELKPHKDLKFKQEVAEYQICSRCMLKLESELETSAVPEGLVEVHLWRHLNDEDRHFQKKRTLEERLDYFNKTYHSMAHLRLPDGRWLDAIAEQVLDPYVGRDLTWDGCYTSPMVPSVEAIYPAVVGEDGLTHYHVNGNITITSVALNSAKKHCSPLVHHAIMLIRDATTKGQSSYESGIALFRILLKNYYEQGFLGHAQQGSRVGKKPPKNMGDVSRSFREPYLLPQTVQNQQVWRFSYNSVGTFQARSHWRHPNHDWLVFQLESSAQEILGEQGAVTYRQFYMRKDINGTEVFFPYSQYSIVPDFTWWDLFEVLSMKAVLNVTACQRPYSKHDPVRQYSSEELYLVVINVWLRMIKKDIDTNCDDYDLGRDEAGLVPQPTFNSLLCASLGHRWPGEVQDLALVDFDAEMKDMKKVGFDADRCGFMWETQYCNYLKYKHNVDTLEEKLFPQLDRIRVANQIHPSFDILPRSPLSLTLDGDLADPFQDRDSLTDKPQSLGRKFTLEQTGAIQSLRKQPARKTRASETVPANESFVDDRDEDGLSVGYDSGDDEEYTDQVEKDEHLRHDELEYDTTLYGSDTIVESIVPGQRNLSNIGFSCYMSSIIQVIAHLPELAQCFTSETIFHPDTGRNPALLKGRDEDGALRSGLRDAVAQIIPLLTSPGSQLGTSFTEKVVRAANKVSSQWENEKNDAAAFFSFLIDEMIVVTDCSKPISDKDIWEVNEKGVPRKRAAYRPVEELDFGHIATVARGDVIDSLAGHAKEHWDAHLTSGHMSIVNQSIMIQCANSYQCDSSTCPAVQRIFSYEPMYRLSIRRDISKESMIPFRQLLRESVRTDYCRRDAFNSEIDTGMDRARACLSEKTHLDDTGDFTLKVTRVTRAPHIFAFEIARPHATLPEIEPADTEPIRPMNLLKDYERFNMKDLSSKNLPTKPTLGVLSQRDEKLDDPSLNAEYQLVAVVAYSDRKLHYTSFVKIGDRWIYFDDMKSQPEFRSPFTQWPSEEGFAQSLLFYRQAGRTDASANEIMQKHEERVNQEQSAPRSLSETIAKLQTEVDDVKSRLASIEGESAARYIDRQLAELNQEQAQNKLQEILKHASTRLSSVSKVVEVVSSPERRGLRNKSRDWIKGLTGLSSAVDLGATDDSPHLTKVPDTPTKRDSASVIISDSDESPHQGRTRRILHNVRRGSEEILRKFDQTFLAAASTLTLPISPTKKTASKVEKPLPPVPKAPVSRKETLKKRGVSPSAMSVASKRSRTSSGAVTPTPPGRGRGPTTSAMASTLTVHRHPGLVDPAASTISLVTPSKTHSSIPRSPRMGDLTETTVEVPASPGQGEKQKRSRSKSLGRFMRKPTLRRKPKDKSRGDNNGKDDPSGDGNGKGDDALDTN